MTLVSHSQQQQLPLSGLLSPYSYPQAEPTSRHVVPKGCDPGLQPFDVHLHQPSCSVGAELLPYPAAVV